MIQITDNDKALTIPPLFRLAFRPMFLGAALFAIVTITLWGLALSGLISFAPYGDLYWWHSHEMIFGFALAVIIGFLLTAIQNWTNVPGVSGWPLAVLFFTWLIARITLAIDFTPNYFIALIDITPPLLAAFFIARSVFKVKQWRNLFFVPILIVFAFTNLASHIALIDSNQLLMKSLSPLMIILITLIMCIIGGRVIPFFTARGTQTEKVATNNWVEFFSVGPLIIFITVHLLFLFIESIRTDQSHWLLVVSGIANLIRILRWRPLLTIPVPLLWSLHIAYLFITSGLLGYGLASMFTPQHAMSLLHLLTIGAMAGLIVAMMSRVSLGHTGRPLLVHKLMPFAFVSIFIAALVRGLLPIVTPYFTLISYQISALLWVICFLIFSIIYWPILTKARVDGRAG
ncbi:NnrS family protein [Psychrobium sp. 1_MG-2023]|uniref:NnrS family protein n=1 Tax=Psychrobium sp. 1_MG-2023 TaxID=3062624 RepID=UPI000C345107|nr:NnrS family protein [Psychrobium sp. 1_MG-2023]MDP2561862.1 NnrS family protein [Psychrobium sp. 1_MG-2023]PKF55771.1 NnrS family protein [Alteromonadales bacterium alter-6D02]